MEFIIPNEDKSRKPNSINPSPAKPSPTSVASTHGSRFNNSYNPFPGMKVEPKDQTITMAETKGQILAHLQKVKDFENYNILHLIDANDIVTLFEKNRVLFRLACMKVYIGEDGEELISEKTAELNSTTSLYGKSLNKTNNDINVIKNIITVLPNIYAELNSTTAELNSATSLYGKSLNKTNNHINVIKNLITELANIYADPKKQFMLLELKNNTSTSPKYILIDCNEYFKSASQLNGDPPQTIETNTEIATKLKNNPYRSRSRSRKTGGKRRGKMNTKRKTKRKIRKINKTKKVKMTNRKNSRYIKRK